MRFTVVVESSKLIRAIKLLLALRLLSGDNRQAGLTPGGHATLQTIDTLEARLAQLVDGLV